MKTIQKNELKAILDAHALWLNNADNGVRANLSDAILTDANLRYTNLYGAILTGANLTNADLRFANLTGANLTGANLMSANLYGANLTNADLRHADLTNADLRYANLTDADLAGANLTGANLSYAKTDKRYISISGIGSSKRMTTYCFEEDKIWCGCFKGTLKEFEQKVEKTHQTNKQYLDEYLGFINYLKSLIKEQGK